MARNNRNDGNRNRNRSDRRSDEPLMRGWSETARERPLATAAAVGAAAAAGAFLWSRRNQISEQLSQLSDQIGEWTESMRPSGSDEFETTGAGPRTSTFAGAGTSAIGSGSPGTSGSAGTSRATGARSSASRSGGRGSRKAGMSETGGGNASLGARSGTTGTGGSTI